MICGQTTRVPLYWNVPLSCVPPCRRFLGRWALADRLWNCSVDKPSFMLMSWLATLFSRLLHSARSAAPRPRVLHLDEMSTSLPSERTTPPSETVMNSSGLPGTVTVACSYGWIASARFGSPSCVRSVKAAPPLVDRSQARPFDGPCSSPYENEPPR